MKLETTVKKFTFGTIENYSALNNEAKMAYNDYQRGYDLALSEILREVKQGIKNCDSHYDILLNISNAIQAKIYNS